MLLLVLNEDDIVVFLIRSTVFIDSLYCLLKPSIKTVTSSPPTSILLKIAFPSQTFQNLPSTAHKYIYIHTTQVYSFKLFFFQKQEGIRKALIRSLVQMNFLGMRSSMHILIIHLHSSCPLPILYNIIHITIITLSLTT